MSTPPTTANSPTTASTAAGDPGSCNGSARSCVVIKLGGSLLEADQIAETALSVAHVLGLAQDTGARCVLVHGGGSQVNKALRAAGHAPEQLDGIRVSPESQIDLIAGVLAGSTNAKLCGQLRMNGVSTVGLTLSDGVPGGSASIRPYDPARGFGRVADAGEGSPALLNTLLEAGLVPVVSSIATGPTDEQTSGDRSVRGDSGLWNVNADVAAGAIAATIKADAVAFVSDVPGVRDKQGAVIAELDGRQTEALIDDGTIRDGMVAKVLAATACVDATGIPAVVVDRLGLAGAIGVRPAGGSASAPGLAGTRLRRSE